MHEGLSSCLPAEHGRTAAGFTLIGVLVIIGVLAITGVIISQSLLNTKTMEKVFVSKQRYRDIEKQLIDTVSVNFSQKLTGSGSCINYNTLFAGSGFLQFATTFNFKSTTPSLAGSLARCQSPYQPATPTNSNDNQFAFCLRPLADPTGSSTRDSFIGADEKLAEVQIRLVDLQTLQPISCATYVSRHADPLDKTAGALLAMRVFWETRVHGDSKLSSHDVNFILNEN